MPISAKSSQSIRVSVAQRGFALVMVLWAAVILALIAGSVTRISRSDLQLVRNVTEATEAELAADSGVRRALYEVAAGSPGAWRTDGSVYRWRFGQAEVRVSITDELGRIDINHASTDLLANLFEAAGARQPESLAGAVEAFRKQRRAAAATGGVSPPDDLPGELRRGVAFASPDDFQNVPGVGADLLKRLRSSITVYSGRALPIIASAPPLVRAAMNVAELSASKMPATRLEVPDTELTDSPTLLSAQAGQASRGSGLYRIYAEALTAGGSHFTREAVVLLKGRRDRLPYDVRLWRRGTRLLFAPRW